MRRPLFMLATSLLLSLSLGAAQASGADDCLACHGEKSLKVERKGKTLSLFVDSATLKKSPHTGMDCVDCHQNFDPTAMPHAKTIQPVDCTSCHADVQEKHRFHAAMAAPGAKLDASSCKDCHGTHAIQAPKSLETQDGKPRPGGACAACHDDVVRQYLASEHGLAAATGVKGAPRCVTCHEHPITDARSADGGKSLKRDQEKLCLSCHLDDPDVRARMTPSSGFIAAYEKSVHGASLLKGNAKAANCVDCHGAHVMKRGADPSSQVSRYRLPETCAQCHSAEAADYKASTHGVAVAHGSKDAPVCTDCHGEHDILKHNDPSSPVATANVSAQVCTPCHSSVRLSEKYDLPKGRPKSFADSYHGLAIRGGSLEAANCASCHGAHKILPSTDPASSISRANLAATCGKCHPGANDTFATGAVHVTTAKADSPILYWIALVYVLLIVGTIGGMLAHNALDFVRKWRHQNRARHGKDLEPEPVGHALYLRMTVAERIQHALIIVSFTLLVVTGFMLSYPDAWWVAGLRRLWGGIFDVRSELHRISAVVMLAGGVFHIGYMTLTKRGRGLFRDLLPKPKDATDAVGTVRYNLGLSSEKPRYGRYSYIEKAEYWALIWGTFVMGATGILMWFENTSMGFMTKLGWDISRTIHFYEAWLAMLAILVWHIYYVVVNPDVYPMNTAWLTGMVTEKEMMEEHPLELEAIKKSRQAAEELARAAPGAPLTAPPAAEAASAAPGARRPPAEAVDPLVAASGADREAQVPRPENRP
jgi:predicted CXXCH cytochrome family protein